MGRYEIRLSGSVPDIWGTSYSLDSVFDVWVAQTLDLEASSLPSTPFEVGDRLPASLTIFPGVPAAIEWEVSVHPIDGSAPVTRTITGTANRFGYFAVADAFSFDVAGEYRSTIQASYTDPAGRLWMATRTWGSGIATPDGALIAHGRRGVDEQPIEARAAWFHPLVHRVSRSLRLEPYLHPLPFGRHPLADARRRGAGPHLRPGHRWGD